MDISFHYYAVKSVALAAGLKENVAQRIANFSQFIDDYNWFAYFLAGNIPDYIKSNELDIVFNNLTGTINPVTTGFYDMFDMATLVLPRSQKFTVSPFHFIPKDKKAMSAKTTPATLNDGSIISNMLNTLKEEYLAGSIDDNDAFMRMGMLLHTFADTHAHQLFTGYIDTKQNTVEIVNVTDNITGEDVTEKNKMLIEKFNTFLKETFGWGIPAMGHMLAGHIPDLTHISFTMNYFDSQSNKHTYGRSNTEVFVKTCKEIYDYFTKFFNIKTPKMSWDELYPKLAEGFLFDIEALLKNLGDSNDLNDLSLLSNSPDNKLYEHWKSVLPQFHYNYNGDEIKNGFILSQRRLETPIILENGETMLFSKNYSDDFYKYNYFADKTLIELYGTAPRSFF